MTQNTASVPHQPAFGLNQADLWVMDHAPSLQCPDTRLERLWNYRWRVVHEHLRFTSHEWGHVITEFTSDDALPWAGAHNTIVCASDHHINETRWLRSPQYAMDHLRFLLSHPGAEALAYSSALADSVWKLYEVHGDADFAIDLLDALIANHHGWRQGRVDYPHDNGYDTERGLFWNTGRDSTGEYNLPSAQLNEPLRGIQGYKIRGGAGYRPDNNSDMYADALAISRIAKLAGLQAEAEEFANFAGNLKQRVHEKLWEPERQFFMHRWRRNEYSGADRHGAPSILANTLIWETNADRFGGVGHQPHENGAGRGRELIGYLPWYRQLVGDTPEYAEAWKYLLDPDYFYASYGPTTAERHDPWFSIQYDCRANGNSFPLNTSRVLNAAANLLHDYRNHGVMTPAAYRDLLDCYVRTQFKDNEPYIAEFHHPDRDEWTVDRPISTHYFHSSFCDLVITGLLGIRPQPDGGLTISPLIDDEWEYFALKGLPWHGHTLDVLYDRDGERYKLGAGLTAWRDGECIARGPLDRRLHLPAPEKTQLLASMLANRADASDRSG